MTVSIVKDWEGDMMRQTPGGKGEWGGVSFVNGNSFWADVIVVLNASPKNLFGVYRKGGKWIMSQEAPLDYYRWQTNSFPSYDRIYTFWNKKDFPDVNIINSQTSLPWHINKSYDELMALEPDFKNKLDEVSWVTSNLNTRPVHSLRLNLIDFLRRQGFMFRLFGRGFVPIADKYDGIAPFKYSIAIENFSCNDYWTEKIADCFLSWTMPIYYGCKNIKDYFPDKSMILIDPHDPQSALRVIKDSMNTNQWEKNIKYIAEARDLVLNKYQFFPSICEKIKEANLSKKRKFSFIKGANSFRA